MTRTARRRTPTGTWLMAAVVLASGCKLWTRDTEGDMSRLLRDYIIAQEMYHAQHRRYAPSADSLTRGFAVPPWIQVQVHQSNPAGHSAHAWSTRDPDLVCVVFAGPLPSELDQGFPGDPMCGPRARFERFLSGWTPPGGNAGQQTGRRWTSVLGIALLVAALLAITYGCGVLLDRVAGTVPKIRALVFWTPAALATVFIGLSSGLGPVLYRVGGYAWGWVALGLAFAAVLNLGLFSVPHAVRRPRSGDWWAALGMLALGAVVYAAFATRVAGDVAAGRRFAAGANPDTVILAVAAATLSLLNLMGIVQLVRVRRRTKPVARPAASEDAGGHDVGWSWKALSKTLSSRMQTRPRVLLMVALIAAVFFLVDNARNRSSRNTEPDRVSSFLRSYVDLQEVYFVDHGRYASDADAGAIPVPVGVTLKIISSSATAHSAIAYEDSTQQICAVWVGEPVPQLDHDRPAVPVCDAPPRFEPWLAAVGRVARVTASMRTDIVTSAGPAALSGAVAESDRDMGWDRIFSAEQWSTDPAFLKRTTLVPLHRSVDQPCSDETRKRLARSIHEVLFCERLATLGDEGEPGGLLVWSILRVSAVPHRACEAGIAYLNEDLIVREVTRADCEDVLAFDEPGDIPVAAFRVRVSGELGLVVDSHWAECAGRVAMLANRDLFERVHAFYYECAR